LRVTKEHDVRRSELLDAAEDLFVHQGYAETTIVDIRRTVGVAQGTFYHYFTSKEEILHAIVDRIVARDLVAATAIADDPTLTPVHKLVRILLAQTRPEDTIKTALTQAAHTPENAALHLTTIVRGIQALSPVMTRVVEQGNATGDFHADHPREVMDILLVSGQVLFDDGLFPWSDSDPTHRLEAYLSWVEVLLGAPGRFGFVTRLVRPD
jgi:AcrR family transcriptional regulator